MEIAKNYADLPLVASPVSVTLCHPDSFTFNHFIDYSSYHAVIIKLQNKQYYLFCIFSGVTDTLSIFQNMKIPKP